jgi:DNA-binding NarL/FixJ family response regulator
VSVDNRVRNPSGSALPSYRGRPLRVLVAEDDPGLTGELAALIGSDPALELVGVRRDADGALAAASEHAPDVLLLDVHVQQNGSMVREIREGSPRVRVIAFSGRATPASSANGRPGRVAGGSPIGAILASIHAVAGHRL